MKMSISLVAIALATAVGSGVAAQTQPETKRPVGKPQANGVPHTLRVFPEACTRIQGQFTGNAAKPYEFAAVRTGERCQPRARIVDAAKVKPQSSPGWVYADLVQVPSAACPSQQAVVRVWRHDSKAAPPKLDAQGRSRLYIKDSMDAKPAANAAQVPMFAVEMGVEGKACR